MKTIRIGSGAGYAGDRIEPAIDLIKKGGLDYICFECLAERTISIAVQQKEKDQNKGYNDLLEERFEKIIPAMAGQNIRIITNMGAANPEAAAEKVIKIIRKNNLKGYKVAAVTGDDVTLSIDKYYNEIVIETGKSLADTEKDIISANAYCGINGIIEALKRGANIIITGRVADPSLFLAPAVYEFGWKTDDWDRLGQGTVMGHLLECAAQVTGGYYADGEKKLVPDLWNVGFPYAEVRDDGTFEITKLEESGGMVTEDTVKEQLLYEIMDPGAYLTPDVVADFTDVEITQVGRNRVSVKGGKGHPRTGKLKVSVGCENGYIGEGEISYAGSGALKRAKLAGSIIRKRIELLSLPVDEMTIDYIGYNSLCRDILAEELSPNNSYNDIRLRIAARTKDIKTAFKIGDEVEALYLNGPSGGGGARKYVRKVVSIVSILIPEENVEYKARILEADYEA